MKIINKNQLNEDFFGFKELEDIDVVRQIIKEVKTEGDEAVKKYTERFDKLSLDNYEITKQEIKQALSKIKPAELEAIKKAAENIKKFAEQQFNSLKSFETNKNGVRLGQRIIPIKKVGCYVPGGNYPLPSAALMTIIPAKVAGVKEIVVCTPKGNPYTIAAANIAGADRIFKVGGVQAIAAMAYGTETIPKVDKIVGPGNKYVSFAKKEVYGIVGIDFIAGPSEVMIIADESAKSDYIAADLLAQAEHDYNAIPILVTTSEEIANSVVLEIKKQLPKLKTKGIAEKSIENNGLIIIVDTMEEAVEIANKKAPEHLELQVKEPEKYLNKLANYGSLFIGNNSAEVFGDYCSGTNHTLPTSGAARYTGGLSVFDFIKIMTYQEIGQEGLKEMVKISSQMAEIEGLEAHKKSALIRKNL